ncbi:MAG: acyl-CoA dehydrogenase family protein [Desulfobacteraceae bacterium]|nr:acyl-CoA dehydrogenase family protein [Desulfobacteraceae bacterium]MBC2757286.1 acyl-CoA dehydrogenase family protein [Desulfobacteraceae bacterium]MBC2763922.1 acyl-CoA dehydrogenase family protein [ANME-2 cluster archaeon]
MNYDFSDKEFNLFVEIHTLISEFVKDKNLESSDINTSAENIRQALALLSQTPYLKLGVEKAENYNGLLTLMGAMEVIAGTSPSLFLSIETSTRIFGRILSTWGSDSQKEKLLNPLLNGQIIGAVGLSEDALNVDNDPLTTTAVADGDSVKISGHKQYVINGPTADWIAVVGMMNGKNVICLVEKGTPGLTIGEKTATLGYEGVAISKIILNDCTIASSQVITPKNDKDMLNTLKLWENQILIGAGLGLMKTAFESAKDHSKKHKTGGKPIIAYQEVGFKLSEMLTLFQTSQLFAYRAAWTADTDPKNVESLTLCAKVFCTESAEQVASEAMKILGGSGFLSGHPVEEAFRCSKYGQIAGTSTEISRVKIGDTALGMNK